MITLIFSSLIPTASGTEVDDALEVVKGTYDGEQFAKTLRLEGSNFPDEVFEIKIIIFEGAEKKDETTREPIVGQWSYETDISTWALGDYKVRLLAHNQNLTVIGQTEFNIKIESDIVAGIMQGEIFDKEFIDKFDGKKFDDKIKFSKTLIDDAYSVEVRIIKDGKTKVEETKTGIKKSWSYEKSVKDWDTGTYDVILIASAENSTVLDTAVFQIEVEEEELFNMALVCAIILIVFIILIIIFFILTLLKHKKIMNEIKFEPKNVVKKLPMMSFMSMFITLLLVIAGLVVCMTAGMELIPFILFLVFLGLLMLITYWTFSDRNYPKFIIYLVFIVLTIVVISLAALWSEEDAAGPAINAALVLSGLILFFISILLYWLTSRRGFLITLVTVILSLVFFILEIVFIVLSALDIMGWWITAILGSVLLMIMLLLGWINLRNDIIYFETRDESKTHRGVRRTLNMFDIISAPRGLFKREYDRKVMGKISYEQTHDKNVRMEVIQLREWDTKPGRAQGRRLMGVYAAKMRGKEGPMFKKVKVAESVKYTIYSSDTNLDDKLKLCKAFGFKVQDSGKERGLDYFDLELVHRPFLGLGSPMGSDKKGKDYDKDSGYARDDKDKDEGREHRYDYKYEEEQKRKERDSSYERDREMEREKEKERDRRRHERESDKDVEDWSSSRRDGDRGRDRDRDRDSYNDRSRGHEREREREPPQEKPKKRPPPPKIVRDV